MNKLICIIILIIFNISIVNAYNLNNSPSSRLSVITMLDGVSTASISDAKLCTPYNKLSVHVISTGVTTGSVVGIYSSLDNNNYAPILTANIVVNGTTSLDVNDFTLNWIKVYITDYIDGTYTANMIAGN